MTRITKRTATTEASLAGDVRKAFERLGGNVAEVKADNLAGAAAARWLGLSAFKRENAGLMPRATRGTSKSTESSRNG